MRRGKTIEQRAREAVAQWKRYLHGHTYPSHDALELLIAHEIRKAIAADRRKRGERG